MLLLLYRSISYYDGKNGEKHDIFRGAFVGGAAELRCRSTGYTKP